ncbi:MAG: head-tail connector protein [Rickettsiaceae bacterium]
MIIKHSITETNKVKAWSLEQVKNYLRVSYDYDDALIVSQLETAIEAAENFIGISLYTRHIVTMIQNSAKEFCLKYSNIQNINSVNLHSGQTKSVITNLYGSINQRNQIFLNAPYVNKDIEIEYIAGYKESEIPTPIKQGILMHIALMYAHLEGDVTLNSKIHDLYLPYRIIKI